MSLLSRGSGFGSYVSGLRIISFMLLLITVVSGVIPVMFTFAVSPCCEEGTILVVAVPFMNGFVAERLDLFHVSPFI